MLRYTTIFCFIIFAVACKSSKKTSETAPTNTQQRGDRRGDPPRSDMIMRKMDANSDGKLSIEEVKGPLKVDFAKIDANADGFLSKSEIENMPRRQGGQRPPRG